MKADRYMVTIDDKSGFCFGVVTAIRKAEEELAKGERLFCLGDIVHNSQEVERLERLGLRTINYDEYNRLSNATVLIRAHGEPPATYDTARRQNINIIDASCPVVRNLQKKIRATYTEHVLDAPEGTKAQIVIFGKQGHAEVIGLAGQTDNTAIVVEHLSDIDRLDFRRDIYLFSQTTKSVDEFRELVNAIQQRISAQDNKPLFVWHDTICAQVRNRVSHIREFAQRHDKVVFVGGRNSSNGKVLFEHCRDANPDTVFIETPQELTDEFIASCRNKNIGICGATSTPYWLMKECAEMIDRCAERARTASLKEQG